MAAWKVAGQGCQIDKRRRSQKSQNILHLMSHSMILAKMFDVKSILSVTDEPLYESSQRPSIQCVSSVGSALGRIDLPRTQWALDIAWSHTLRHQNSFLQYFYLSLLSHVPKYITNGWHERSPVGSPASFELQGRQGPGNF